MKMNIILMIIGAVIFAVGAAMTFKKPEQEKTNEIYSAAVNNGPVARQDEKPQESHDPVIDENKQKGNDFEDYVANVLNANSLTIKDWKMVHLVKMPLILICLLLIKKPKSDSNIGWNVNIDPTSPMKDSNLKILSLIDIKQNRRKQKERFSSHWGLEDRHPLRNDFSSSLLIP